jgi:hypothetical protein
MICVCLVFDIKRCVLYSMMDKCVCVCCAFGGGKP